MSEVRVEIILKDEFVKAVREKGAHCNEVYPLDKVAQGFNTFIEASLPPAPGNVFSAMVEETHAQAFIDVLTKDVPAVKTAYKGFYKSL